MSTLNEILAQAPGNGAKAVPVNVGTPQVGTSLGPLGRGCKVFTANDAKGAPVPGVTWLLVSTQGGEMSNGGKMRLSANTGGFASLPGSEPTRINLCIGRKL